MSVRIYVVVVDIGVDDATAVDFACAVVVIINVVPVDVADAVAAAVVDAVVVVVVVIGAAVVLLLMCVIHVGLVHGVALALARARAVVHVVVYGHYMLL